MPRTTFSRIMAITWALTSLCFLSACAQKHMDGFDAQSIAVPETTALGGAALLQRKFEMQRAVADMAAFHRTMEGMIERQDRSSVEIFSSFTATYIVNHLRPMLKADWQSSHAELVDLDINLRVLEIAMLVQMRNPKQVKWALGELVQRYEGRDSLLVDFPIGQQSSLGAVRQGLEQRMGACLDNKSKWGPGAQKRSRKGGSYEPICIGPV